MNIVREAKRASRPDEGLRERKKTRTRQALIEAAMRVYRDKGFEGVTVAEIARQADVAPRTFFGYFETKEDVFLGRGDDRLELLVQAIKRRNRREPILAAILPVLIEERAAQRADRPAGVPDLAHLLRQPAIASRLRERWNRWEDMLAEAIAEDVGARPGDPAPRVVAAAITGAIRVASAAAREQPQRRKQVAQQAFQLLVSGLESYGAEPGSHRNRRQPHVASRADHP